MTHSSKSYLGPAIKAPRSPAPPQSTLGEGPRIKGAKPGPSSRSRAGSKKCVKCGESGPLDKFPKHPTSKDGRASYCVKCKNGLGKERRLKDPIARLTHYIVTRIKNELPKEAVPDDIQTELGKYLGYEMFELKKHLRTELKEREGITLLKSFKEGYHMDHIKPHVSFNITKVDSQAFRDCWHYTNLMMISSAENLKKGAKYVEAVE